MAGITVLSLNGQDMIALVGRDGALPAKSSLAFRRGHRLGEFITTVNADVVGLGGRLPAGWASVILVRKG
jgi:hypothetical protein